VEVVGGRYKKAEVAAASMIREKGVSQERQEERAALAHCQDL